MDYKDMQPHQQRVVDEKRELDTRVSALLKFVEESTTYTNLDVDEQLRLDSQYYYMVAYSDVLGDRINNFKA